MKSFPYSRLVRAFGPRPAYTIEALGHRFVPSGEVELVCRPCGFVIWKVENVAGAENAVRDLGGGQCPEARLGAAPEGGDAQ